MTRAHEPRSATTADRDAYAVERRRADRARDAWWIGLATAVGHVWPMWPMWPVPTYRDRSSMRRSGR